MAVKARYDLDRSAAHEILSTLDPRFRKLRMNEAGAAISEFLEAWYNDNTTLDMYAYARDTHLPLTSPISTEVLREMFTAVANSALPGGGHRLRLVVEACNGVRGEVRQRLTTGEYKVVGASWVINVWIWTITQAAIEVR
jgi:hypothetical protein